MENWLLGRFIVGRSIHEKGWLDKTLPGEPCLASLDSLDRFDRICQFAGVEIGDLIERLERGRALITELTEDIKGKDVLLVEDIVDSGLTVQHLLKTLTKKKPRSIKVCTLLNKPDSRTINLAIDCVGFKIPNKYVVGYGLDYQQKYRNLPYLAVLDVEEDQE